MDPEWLLILQWRLADPGTWILWLLILAANALAYRASSRRFAAVLVLLAWYGLLFRMALGFHGWLMGSG